MVSEASAADTALATTTQTDAQQASLAGELEAFAEDCPGLPVAALAECGIASGSRVKLGTARE